MKTEKQSALASPPTLNMLPSPNLRVYTVFRILGFVWPYCKTLFGYHHVLTWRDTSEWQKTDKEMPPSNFYETTQTRSYLKMVVNNYQNKFLLWTKYRITCRYIFLILWCMWYISANDGQELMCMHSISVAVWWDLPTADSPPETVNLLCCGANMSSEDTGATSSSSSGLQDT